MNEAKQWQNLNAKIKYNFLADTSNMTIKNGIATNDKGEDITHRVEVKPKLNTPSKSYKSLIYMLEHEKKNGGYVFALFKEMQTMDGRFPNLTSADFSRLMFIGSYVAWNTGKLTYDNGRAIDKNGLHNLINISRKRFNEFYNRLITDNIIAESTDGIFVNPGVFYRGSLKEHPYNIDDLQHTRMYRISIRDLYEKFNGRSIGQLALVYAVLPFINYRTNVLAYNADETEADKVRAISLDKLAILLGYENPQKLKTALNKVKVDKYPVFGFFEVPHDRRTFRTVINPNVFFAAGPDELAVLYTLFGM